VLNGFEVDVYSEESKITNNDMTNSKSEQEIYLDRNRDVNSKDLFDPKSYLEERKKV